MSTPFDDGDPQRWIKASIKSGGNFDAPLVTYTATSATEMLELLNDPNNQAVLNKVSELGHNFSKQYKPIEGPAAPASPGSGNKQWSRSAPKAKVYEAPNGRTEPCPHNSTNGLMEYRTGQTKKDPNKSYQAFFCTLPMNGSPAQGQPPKCDAIFL